MSNMRDVEFLNTGLRTPYGKTNTQFNSEFDPSTGTIWGYFNPRGTPCFSLGLLKDIRMHDSLLETNAGHVQLEGAMHEANFYVVARASRACSTSEATSRCSSS